MATKTKSRLGRGLGNLITGGVQANAGNNTAKPKAGLKSSTKTKPAAPRETSLQITQALVQTKEPSATLLPYQEIPIDMIEANPFQPRKDFNEEHIKELAESIRSEGLLQPIVVRKQNDAFQLIAGERRLRACKHIGLKKIPARIIKVNDISSAIISLIENLQRENLNPIDEALGLASLIRDFDLTQEAVAERVGKNRSTVANALRLLQLDKEIQGYLSKALLSTGHAKVILGIEDRAQRILLARKIIENGMSVRETEHFLKQQKSSSSVNNHKRNTNSVEQSVIHNLEKQMTSFLNTNVQLQHSAKKGKIVIEYFGNDDLKRILDCMGMH